MGILFSPLEDLSTIDIAVWGWRRQSSQPIYPSGGGTDAIIHFALEDDDVVWRYKENISQVDEYVIFAVGTENWAGPVDDASLPATFYLDSVNVYQ